MLLCPHHHSRMTNHASLLAPACHANLCAPSSSRDLCSHLFGAQARTREREQVRQSLAWNEVYRPPKTDRVQVSWTLSKLAL